MTTRRSARSGRSAAPRSTCRSRQMPASNLFDCAKAMLRGKAGLAPPQAVGAGRRSVARRSMAQRGEGAMAKPVKFAHVVYMTRRFDQMIAWYRDVFEAEIVYENPALAFLTYDDEHHRFAFANLDLLKPDGKSPDDR